MDISKKTVLVLGAGKTGIASTFFLLDKAKKILLSESKEESTDLKDKIQELKKAGVEIEFNKNSNEFLKKADLVIISPGISPESEIVKKLISFNIPFISDIELAKNFIKKPIIAVTGTNGKTTTTSLIAHLINSSSKKAIACGNIGKPLIELVKSDVDYFVLEISSFQIFYSPTLSCKIAICLNVTPDHLDWHGSFEHYVEAKKKLFLQQKKDSWTVLNYSDKLLRNFKLENNVFYFSSLALKETFQYISYLEGDYLKIKYKDEFSNIINKNELTIIGLHNIENALASIAVTKIIGLADKDIKEGLKSFKGVEHRLELVRKFNDKEFYNDSKATNPEATVKAIEALAGKNISLILGGRDKKTKLNEMINKIKQNVTEVILFGEAKERFQDELTKNNYKKLKIVNDLNEAVREALNSKAEIVLFSPACASFDMFKNYEERGEKFKELVRKF